MIRASLPASAVSVALTVSVAVGLVVGGLTSPAQTLLGGTVLSGLANAVSPWLLAPFLLGARGRSRALAAAAGALACVGEVAGYYLVSAARGFGVNPVTVAVWVVCGVVGGVVFGLAGRGWTGAHGGWRGLGPALLVAAWACEAIVTFAVVLRYVEDAVVFGVVAVLLFVLLGVRGRQHAQLAVWLVPALIAGVGGELLLHEVL